MDTNLTNDGVYKCGQCGITLKCFTSDGSTEFCPGCGSRSDEFESEDEE